MRVALPVEIKVRDLQGSIWLALHLVERGHEVVLGESPEIKDNLDIIEPNVYIQYGLTNKSYKLEKNKILQESGVSIVSLESEGGVFRSDEVFKQTKLHEENFDFIDVHCVWGQHQAKLVKSMINEPVNNILISGHPRFDLLAEGIREIYLDKAKEYIDSYGDYILVNTNFASANNSNKKQSNFDTDRVNYELDLQSEYIKMVKNISNDFDTNVIIRPHPVEDKSTYCKSFSEENVHVVHRGNVRPWILGAKAVIHRSSTSGIESVLLNKPTFSYRPIKNDNHDNKLPIDVSNEQTDYESLKNNLATLSDKNEDLLTIEKEELLKSYFHNTNNPVAASVIANKINTFPESNNIQLNDLKPPFYERIKRVGVGLFGTETVESVGEKIFRTNRSSRQKVSCITMSELEFEVDKFKQHTHLNLPDIELKNHSRLRNTFIFRPK